MQEVKEENVVMKGRFRVEHTIDAPGSSPSGLAWDGQSLWVSDSTENRVYKIDPESGQVKLTIPFDGEVAGTCWDGSHLWQVDNRTKTISQIDPENGQIAMALACDPGEGKLAGLCYDGEDLWLAVTGTSQLRRIRTADGVIAKIHVVEKNILGVGHDGRRIWYTDVDNDRARLMDPATGTELMSYELGGKPAGIAFVARNSFWYCDGESGNLIRYTLVQRS